MSKSLVAVTGFRDSKNGKPQVKLVVIEGDDLPARLAIQSASYATLHGLSMGDEKVIIWRESGDKEEVIRDGKKTGEFRSVYTYDVLNGGAYSTEYIKQAAKESAKMSVREAIKAAPTRRAVKAIVATMSPSDAFINEIKDLFTSGSDVDVLKTRIETETTLTAEQKATLLAELV